MEVSQNFTSSLYQYPLTNKTNKIKDNVTIFDEEKMLTFSKNFFTW